MPTLVIDIETYSPVPLGGKEDCGVHQYAAHPEFEILMIAYAVDNGPVEIIDCKTADDWEKFVHIKNLIRADSYTKIAYNAAFEMTCLAAAGFSINPGQWECTMVRSAMCGLPLGLDQVAKVLKLEQQKDAAGKALIKYFAMPCKPTKANGMRTRNLPEHAPEKWEDFKKYCIQDVETERAIRNKLAFYNISDYEHKLWLLDQEINNRGVPADKQLIENAIAISAQHTEYLVQQAKDLTGLDNPNSVAQLKTWLEEATGEEVTTLNKAKIKDMLKDTPEGTVKEALELRKEMGKSSVKKYGAMLNRLGADHRIRGIHQYYGANRTGRWAGRGVQPQNMPKNFLSDLDYAREMVLAQDYEGLQLFFGDVPDTLSQLLRTAFKARDGYRLIVSDFSAIEARVLAWMAGEKWRLEVFKTHGMIYEASASMMFKVPIDEIAYFDQDGNKVKGPKIKLRSLGKVAELALGYQGGVNAVTTMDIDKAIPEEEKQGLVDSWRKANPNVVAFWWACQRAAIEAVKTGQVVSLKPGFRFAMHKNVLKVELPSKRQLIYQQPGLEKGAYGDIFTYWGLNQTTKKWEKMQMYGGKWAENFCQAVARDCLAEGLFRLDRAGYPIIMHVHDEVVMEAPEGFGSAEEVARIMAEPISWAPGLPLGADSYETKYYRKDD